jgi:hypothetical protein
MANAGCIKIIQNMIFFKYKILVIKKNGCNPQPQYNYVYSLLLDKFKL